MDCLRSDTLAESYSYFVNHWCFLFARWTCLKNKIPDCHCFWNWNLFHDRTFQHWLWSSSIRHASRFPWIPGRCPRTQLYFALHFLLATQGKGKPSQSSFVRSGLAPGTLAACTCMSVKISAPPFSLPQDCACCANCLTWFASWIGGRADWFR